MDLYDQANFFKFFKDLYSENTIDSGTTDRLKNETTAMQLETIDEEVDEILNSEISAEELNRNIKKLKRGKAAAEDGIANEFLSHSSTDTRQVILKAFNECL